ncbi:MAG: NUDIX domain-containing protein [Gammaproteobacteria bacterium]|nr:NUDIX domain-containing protein [Gammaproteobacteria bacterium]
MKKPTLNTFTHNDYEILKREVLYEGVFRMVRLQLRFRLFDGSQSDIVLRELMERQSAVAVLPYDPVTDKVMLIEQFRPGALANPQSPWLLEVIAGIIKPAEKMTEVAIREAKEEAGCNLLNLYRIHEYFVSPGGCNEYLHLYCGQMDASTVEGDYGLKEENEDIHTIILPADEAFILLQEGKIKTSPAIISLQWLQLNREWLRQLWQKN